MLYIFKVKFFLYLKRFKSYCGFFKSDRIAKKKKKQKTKLNSKRKLLKMYKSKIYQPGDHSKEIFMV